MVDATTAFRCILGVGLLPLLFTCAKQSFNVRDVIQTRFAVIHPVSHSFHSKQTEKYALACVGVALFGEFLWMAACLRILSTLVCCSLVHWRVDFIDADPTQLPKRLV